MTWEETITYIRTQPQFKELVTKAYLEKDLSLNVERFKESEEFQETLPILRQYAAKGKKLLDIGCGNGISSVAFAQAGYQVTALEPDPSDTIGAGAVRHLKKQYGLHTMNIIEALAEELQLPDNYFDSVYFRQAMHHAKDLEKFLEEAVRVLKPKGLLLSVRDHVVFGQKDKEWFLAMHPLHRFYGGENAYYPSEYKEAMKKAGVRIVKELKHFDSVINFAPISLKEFEQLPTQRRMQRKEHLRKKLGILAGLPFLYSMYDWYLNQKQGGILSEKQVAGRMYSYIAIKSS
ncbi:MAG: class I SAM-dependent methyltransferase [Bacteroidota bacterium]